MKLFKTIPIEGDRLSAELLANLDEGETITAYCETLAEKDNARQNAYYIRRNLPRPDGLNYEVKTSNLNGTVTVSVIK